MLSTEEDSGTDIHPTTTIEKVPSPVPEGLPRSDSKPHVAVLERSSLLMEDTIDATHRGSVVEGDKDLPNKKYPRRTRKKPKSCWL